MGELMRALDWSRTALGPVETWPQSLRTTVSTCLDSRFAIVIWWGPEMVTLYNDRYIGILGEKHPEALGMRAKEIWPYIWHIVGPMLQGVMERAEATWSDNLLLELERNGYPEECYFTFSYSPIRDESGGVGGIFTPVQETTSQFIGERRLRTLRDLAEDARVARAQTSEEICRLAGRTLAKNPHDVPFAAFYLFSGDCSEARLEGTSGIPAGAPLFPALLRAEDAVSAQWPFARVFHDSDTHDSGQRLTGPETSPVPANVADVPCGAWPLPPHEVLLLPLSSAGLRIGFAILAISPRKRLDEDYLSFLTLIGSHVTTAIVEARSLEEERNRATALAEIDRAKTTFFSNVSHEFRTPLTLMLGPLEDLLSMESAFPPHAGALLSVAHRNGLRLQRLVNTLLDFSRIEAGRVQASYEPTELAAFTADLASSFRAAVEKAGLELIVDCPPLPEPVHVDRDMWEKIVLNLLSNAFKYTFEGSIAVRMRAKGEHTELAIEDTGTGIPEHELPHLFERFHRVEGARGRTQEGTGIGLALVAELIRLQGGAVTVDSTLGRGSTFKVSIPFGTAHLPRERVTPARAQVSAVSSTALHVESFIEEVAGWLPRANSLAAASAGNTSMPERTASITATARKPSRPAVLVADDNADMRDYISRLLAGQYEVHAVTNGEEALAAVIGDAPDLVLSDVMMPGLDGFALIRALRQNPATSAIPVILLSARAGEESRVEGLDAGATITWSSPSPHANFWRAWERSWKWPASGNMPRSEKPSYGPKLRGDGTKQSESWRASGTDLRPSIATGNSSTSIRSASDWPGCTATKC